MSDQSQHLNVFLDLLPNQPKNEQGRDNFRQMLRQQFEEGLPDAVERIWELPPIILKKPFEGYLKLMLEARELFIAGNFYSCVAMCGIVGERLVKGVLRASVLVDKNGQPMRPKEPARRRDRGDQATSHARGRHSISIQGLRDQGWGICPEGQHFPNKSVRSNTTLHLTFCRSSLW